MKPSLPSPQLREAFEAWATLRGHDLIRAANGPYVWGDTEYAWKVWQAATLAALPQQPGEQPGQPVYPGSSTSPDRSGDAPLNARAMHLRYDGDGMPWKQAEAQALNELGINDDELDEIINEHNPTVLTSLLPEADVRAFVRGILVHEAERIADIARRAQPTAQTEAALPDPKPVLLLVNSLILMAGAHGRESADRIAGNPIEDPITDADIDALEAQVKAAVLAYGHQCRAAGEAEDILRELPKIDVQLPDGDQRTVKVWFTERTSEGWRVSVQVDGEPTLSADARDATCEWREEDPWGAMPGTWESACGEAWSFIEGGPAENSVRFCQGCGKPVALVPFKVEDDEGEGDAAMAQARADNNQEKT